jgi:hypothetical protein
MATAELLETKFVPAGETAKAPEPKRKYKYKYVINYGTYCRTTGYDPVYSEQHDEEEVRDAQGNVTGVKVTKRRRIVDWKARPPEVFRAKIMNRQTGVMTKVDPSDNDIIETDLELDLLYPSMASSDYPLRKFQRIDSGMGFTGRPEVDAIANEAYERGKREILAAMAAKGIQVPEDALVESHRPSPVEDAEANSEPEDGMMQTLNAMDRKQLVAMAAENEIDVADCRTERQMRKRIRENM